MITKITVFWLMRYMYWLNVQYFSFLFRFVLILILGWSIGVKVLGKPPEPGRPPNSDKSRVRAYCACSRCGCDLFGHFTLVLFLPL